MCFYGNFTFIFQNYSDVFLKNILKYYREMAVSLNAVIIITSVVLTRLTKIV